MDFVEICNFYVGKMIIKVAKKIFNSDEICRSYSDLNFGVTFFGTQCRLRPGRMSSCVGRDLFTCTERCDVSVNGLLRYGFNGHSVKSLCERPTPAVYYSSALETLKLLIIRLCAKYFS